MQSDHIKIFTVRLVSLFFQYHDFPQSESRFGGYNTWNVHDIKAMTLSLRDVELLLRTKYMGLAELMESVVGIMLSNQSFRKVCEM